MQDTATNPIDGGLSDSTRRPTKRARVEASTAIHPVQPSPSLSDVRQIFPPTAPTGRFLKLHWKLLQALYKDDDDGEDDDDDDDEEEEDGPLSQEWGDAIERFMRDRGQVRALESQTKDLQNLFDEAVDVLESGQQEGNERRSDPPTTHAAVSSGRRGRYPAVLFGRRGNASLSQPSPFPSSSRHFPFMSSHQSGESRNGNLCESRSAFGLVAGLLQTKVQDSRGKFRRMMTPLEPLAEHLVERIDRLEKYLVEGRRTHPSTPRHVSTIQTSCGEEASPIRPHKPDGVDRNRVENTSVGETLSEKQEERHARIETKLRLWKILQADLMHRV